MDQIGCVSFLWLFSHRLNDKPEVQSQGISRSVHPLRPRSVYAPLLANLVLCGLCGFYLFGLLWIGLVLVLVFSRQDLSV